MNPTGMVGCNASLGNDTVDVRMEQQVLSPRVQDGKEPNLRAKMFGICCHFQEGIGHGTEQ